MAVLQTSWNLLDGEYECHKATIRNSSACGSPRTVTPGRNSCLEQHRLGIRLISAYKILSDQKTRFPFIVFMFNLRFLKSRPSLVCAVALALGPALPAWSAPIKNIVLVHGAFVDGSGWQGVYAILVKDGYHVTLVQQPLVGLEEDTAATKRIIERQDGPCVLVGHSYGGSVITEAGTDPKWQHWSTSPPTPPPRARRRPTTARSSPTHPARWSRPPIALCSWTPPTSPRTSRPTCRRKKAGFLAHAQMPTAAKVFTTPVTNPA